jgi:hypothetical protein
VSNNIATNVNKPSRIWEITIRIKESNMFIKVKGERDEDVLINTRKITFIVSNKWSGSVIDFGDGTYIKSNTSIADIEKMIEETSKEN